MTPLFPKFEKVSFEQYLDAVLGDIYFPSTKEEDIRNVYDAIQLPRRATSGSAGYDFFVPTDTVLTDCRPRIIATGIRVLLPPGTFLMCVPRSGLGFKHGVRLRNGTGIIDEDYAFSSNEGHIMASMTTESPIALRAGERFMQGIILPYAVTGDDNPIAKRRDGGFGSTDGDRA